MGVADSLAPVNPLLEAMRQRTDDPALVAPEPMADLQAQLQAIRDPASAKDAMLVTGGNGVDGLDLSGLHAVPTERGVLVTSNADKARAASQVAGSITDGQMAELLGYGMPKQDSDGTVVLGRDAQGNVVHGEATTQGEAQQAAQRAQAMAPKGGSVQVTRVEDALRERAQRLLQEQAGGGMAPGNALMQAVHERQQARQTPANAEQTPANSEKSKVKPAPFASYEEADQYRREQNKRGASVRALPVPVEGGFALVPEGDPRFAQASALRDERVKAKQRQDAGRADGDILNKLGQPFTNKGAAARAAKKAGDGFEPVPVKGGFVVRKGKPQLSPEQQALQDELRAEQDGAAAVDENADQVFARTVEDAGEAPAELSEPKKERRVAAKAPEQKSAPDGPKKSAKEYLAGVEQARLDAIEAGKAAPRESVDPSKDRHLGVNDFGDQVYERKDGFRYTLRDGKVRTGTLLQTTEEAKEESAQREAGQNTEKASGKTKSVDEIAASIKAAAAALPAQARAEQDAAEPDAVAPTVGIKRSAISPTNQTPSESRVYDRWLAMVDGIRNGQEFIDPSDDSVYVAKVTEAGVDKRGKQRGKSVILVDGNGNPAFSLASNGEAGQGVGFFGASMDGVNGPAWKVGRSGATADAKSDSKPQAGAPVAPANPKANAKNPLFHTVTNKDGGAFASQAAAQREVNRLGLQDTHEVVQAGGGFVGRIKPSQTSHSRKFPPTDVRMGDTVRKDGKDYTVSGVVEGGITATREVAKHGSGVTEEEVIVLRGDDEVLGAWHAANGDQASDRQNFAEAEANTRQSNSTTDEASVDPELDMLRERHAMATKALSRVNGGSLAKALRGVLSRSEWRDIGGLPTFYLGKGGRGAEISSLVADGQLDGFLPPNMRHDSARFDEQDSTEYIKEMMRAGTYLSYDARVEIEQLGYVVAELEAAIDEILTLREANEQLQIAAEEQRRIDEDARIFEPGDAQGVDGGVDSAPGRQAARQAQGEVSQDLLGDAPSAGQQAASTERARRAQQEQAKRNAAPGPEDFTLGMEDARTGREVDPNQQELLGKSEPNYLDILFPSDSPAVEGARESTNVVSQNSSPTEVAAVLRLHASEHDAIAQDWIDRKYKNNKKSIHLPGDGPRNHPSISVNAANEARRSRTVEAAQYFAHSMRAMADRIESGYNPQDAIERAVSWADGEYESRKSSGHNVNREDMRDQAVAGMVLNDQNHTFGKNSPARVLRLAYQRAGATQDKTTDTKPERITPDSAANMKAGDVVVDEDGKEYRAHAARHKWLEAHPIENGKANVSADTMVTFHLDPQSAGSYPERSHKAVFLKNEPSADGGAKPAESKPAAKPIEDFGEKLEGARKDLPPSLKEELGDEQIASLPLSKIWPADAHESIEDAAAAALAFAARQEIPAKPRVAYKVRAWVEKVKTFRTIVANMKGSLDDMERRAGDGGFRSLAPFFARVRLLAQLPRASWGRVEKVGEYPDAHRFAEGGTKTAMPFSEVMVDGKTQRFEGVGKIGPDEVDQLKALLAGEKPKAGALTAKDFEVRGTAKTGYKINRKGDPEYRALKIFTGEGAAKAALAWRDEHTADLESAWEAAKARDNVAKADVRRDENRERTGESRRNGKDVTPEMFTDAFGFRGTQFGNWVSQGVGAKSRQGLLNEAYDAMLDLAEVLGIPPKAISLNGTLGLSLGARGAGKAAAHFEPSNLVINLTKTRGAGTLAHEWFHALDNYFSRMRGGEVAANDQESYRRGNYITYRPQAAWVSKLGGRSVPMSSAQLKNYLQTTARWNDGKTLDENAEAAGWQRDPNHKEGVRPQVEQAFAELVQALNESPMAKRAGRLDKGNGNDGYWGRIIERGARSFENYVISKLAQRGWSNDFLANIRSFEESSQIGKNAERYPYLTPQEEAPVVAAFDKLFETVETREGEDGKVLLFSRSAPAKSGATTTTIATAIRKAYGNALDRLQAKGLVTLVQSQNEAIEAAAKARAEKTGEPVAQVRERLMASVRKSIANSSPGGIDVPAEMVERDVTMFAGLRTVHGQRIARAFIAAFDGGPKSMREENDPMTDVFGAFGMEVDGPYSYEERVSNAIAAPQFRDAVNDAMAAHADDKIITPRKALFIADLMQLHSLFRDDGAANIYRLMPDSFKNNGVSMEDFGSVSQSERLRVFPPTSQNRLSTWLSLPHDSP